jgi:hypothetical protein
MSRRLLALAAVLASACNTYNFTPAGHCIVQPGTVSVHLSKVSTADLLFVVDDSPSTDPKQAGLAASFSDFIQRIVQTNTSRAAKGLEPIDFHIAVTTSSIFEANPAPGSCVQSGSGTQCCQQTACTNVASCTRGTSQGCGAGQVCVVSPVIDQATGLYLTGEQDQCCTTTACAPSACAPGDPCPALSTVYETPLPRNCTPGIAVPGAPYPDGDLVSAAGNPVVLDFPKTLGWASWGTQTPDPALTRLVQQFEQNVKVGSCGSGEEQHLQAARVALQKALGGQQPGVAKGAWPHPGAKLVVVWVGDEDDCSSPQNAPLVMPVYTPGADACVLDKHRPAADQREIPVAELASFLTGLRQPNGPAADLAAAFIVSAVRCADGTYAPADSCTGTASCPARPPASCNPPVPVCGGAYAAGERFFAMADALKAAGIDVVEGTVCDAYPPSTFGAELSAIADLAAPPASLHLPTLPASAQVTTVSISNPSGTTRKVCQQGSDWCFVSCSDTSPTPACLPSGTVSQCVAINHATGQCEANPDETYSAEYAGIVPAGGCATADECQKALGGATSDWTCAVAPGAQRGSCLCAGG